MNSRRFLAAAILLLPCSNVFAEEEETQDWDVNAIPGEPRDVTIDTRSGTWMSVDVSPDGKSVAFDLLGDIYVVSIDGGDASERAHQEVVVFVYDYYITVVQ